jgi:NADH-quinone oxidoreductase subunit E
VPASNSKPAAAGKSEKPKKPKALKAARKSGPDDLKLIKGVGPKLEALLNALGFFHFDQVAGWTAAELAWVDDNLEGFKGRASRDTWIEQARLLAAGGETEFSARAKKGT